MIGNARARHGSTTISSPSRNLRMCSWQVAVPSDGPWARPLIIIEQEPQMPSRQSWSKAIGSRPSAVRRSLTTSNISRNDISGLMSRGVDLLERTGCVGARLAPDAELEIHGAGGPSAYL